MLGIWAWAVFFTSVSVGGVRGGPSAGRPARVAALQSGGCRAGAPELSEPPGGRAQRFGVRPAAQLVCPPPPMGS
jgi:hypothetical protein